MMIKTMLGAVAGLALFAGSSFAQDLSVKIGVLNDRSGIYADITGEGSVVAARMAVEDFNAKNPDIKVEVVSADHQNKPDIASNIARQWYDQDGVDAIFDLPTSSTALAVSEVTREKNKVIIVSGGGTSDLTGKNCSPNTIHWTYDTWSLGNGTASALVQKDLKKWFFITADYAFGHALERDTSQLVKAAGGEVLGSVKYPFPGQDFSSYLLQAQSSGAQVVALANAGGDFINSMKQASEFGIVAGGQNMAGLLVFITDINALGLEAAQGLNLTEAFYWDLNDNSRAFSDRYEKIGGKKPGMVQAGVYSSVLHYLEAIKAVGSKDAKAVVAKLKEAPIQDSLFGTVTVRPDGRAIHDMYLFQVKKPSESKGPWDFYNLVSTIPADKAFRPIEDGGCKM
ncbi:ABC transporter substrate-binding protein [Rhodoligotrophos appendicifer]|uniref:ABC transporter substrate-binding protein n=1 Tax=Rhodoligotrophos appendicifer TaxID=987056 RepID=UPI001184FA9E|nr:ABC transporter substrate-binding protein [Rhodoligotrophos appendicifer]